MAQGHANTMPHRMTTDGLACPRNCPYDGEDRLEARNYDWAGNNVSGAGQVVETKEGGTTGPIGNVERDPFGGSSSDDGRDYEWPKVERKSLDRAFIENDRTGHYPAARNCIFSSEFIDAEGKCDTCPEKAGPVVIDNIRVESIGLVTDPLPGMEFNAGDTGLAEYAEAASPTVDDYIRSASESFGLDPDKVIAQKSENVQRREEWESGLKKRGGDQELPQTNSEDYCQETFLGRVSYDVPRRLQIGIARYGTGLQPFNGRDFMRDAWEEYLDLGQYIEGLRRERDRMILVLKAVVASDYAEAGGGRAVVTQEAETLLRAIGELGGDDAPKKGMEE